MAHEGSHTATVDRYLETIFYIAAEGGPVRPSQLVSWLGVSAPTVSEGLKRLERDGWITTARDRSVQLTTSGADIARAIVRRHRVLERWLTDVLGFDWAEADVEAERIATTISDEVIARIDRSMGEPATCPHGNAIPGRDPGYRDLVPLSSLPEGSVGVVRRISEVAEHEGHHLLRQLADSGVGEGREVAVGPSDGDEVTVVVGERSVTLSAHSAASIWLDPAAAPAAT
jgi:DtxR family transcriptional regulator, iron-dependent repressor